MSDRRFRIAMVAACPFPARRGTPVRVERLSDALARRGHAVEVVTYHVAQQQIRHLYGVRRTFGRIRLSSIPPGPTLAKLLLYDPALALLLKRLLRGNAFDVIHAHHVEGVLAAAWARGRSGVPLVCDAHTLLESELPSYGLGLPRGVKRLLGAWLDRRVPLLADHVITVTPEIRDRLAARSGPGAGRVTVAMNGVEAERFPAGDPAAVMPDRVLYSGTLAPYQGIDLLLRAFARARERRPSLHLVLAVSSSFEPYEALARELGVGGAMTLERDSFEALPERLAQAALAVLPRPICDGIPQKLLNYMAAGTPVVAFSGSAKLLEHERTGLVVEDGNVEGFARAIVRLAEDPGLARRLGCEARRHVLREYTWDGTARRCEEVYAGLLGRADRGAGSRRTAR